MTRSRGRAVAHHEVRVAQPPGRAEVENLPSGAAVEHDCGVAQRAERDRNRHRPKRVVRDLVPDEDLDRVGAHLAGDVHGDHGFTRFEVPHIAHVLELRVVQRGDPVLWRPTRRDLVEADCASRKVGPGPLCREITWDAGALTL